MSLPLHAPPIYRSNRVYNILLNSSPPPSSILPFLFTSSSSSRAFLAHSTFVSLRGSTLLLCVCESSHSTSSCRRGFIVVSPTKLRPCRPPSAVCACALCVVCVTCSDRHQIVDFTHPPSRESAPRRCKKSLVQRNWYTRA